MRTELYELYKEQHPEELTEIRRAYHQSEKVEEIRKQARMSKVSRVQKWKDILEAENREETENGEGETGSGS